MRPVLKPLSQIHTAMQSSENSYTLNVIISATKEMYPTKDNHQRLHIFSEFFIIRCLKSIS